MMASQDLSNPIGTSQGFAKIIELPAIEPTASFRQAKNRLLPPMRLPFELMGHVFEIACEPEPTTPRWQPDFLGVLEIRRRRLAIGSTCSHFRRVLLKTRAAWNHILVLLDGNSHPLNQTRHVVPLELSRASHRTVHLYICFKNAERGDSSDFMVSWKHLCATFPSMQDHLETLLIESDQTLPYMAILDGISSGHIFPALKALHINIRGQSTYGRLDLRAFPSLEILSIRYIVWTVRRGDPFHHIAIASHPCSVIRELTLEGHIRAEDALSLLQLCRESLEIFRWIWEDGGPAQILPRPPRFPVLLPRLRALDFTKPDPFSFLDPSRFDMPNLRDLVLGHAEDYTDSKGMKPIVLPSLHSCEIGHTYWGTANLSSFLNKNPSIRCIKTMAHLPKVADFFWAALATPGSEGTLPNLERLHDMGIGRHVGSLDLWFEYIRTREHPFLVCLQEYGTGLDNELYDQYPDVLRVEPYNSLVV